MIAALLTLCLAFGSAEPSAVERAERAYRAGEFATALALFEAASLAAEAPPGALLFAMGNCEYRLGHHAEAVRQYRRALRWVPRDTKVWANLRLAERQLGLDAPDRRSPAAVLQSLATALTPREMLWFAVGLQCSGLVGFVLSRRRTARRSVCAAGAVVGLLLALHCARVHGSRISLEAVVLAKEIAVRADPHASLPPAFRLRAGEVVRVAEASDRWVRLTCAAGAGWTERAGVGLVD